MLVSAIQMRNSQISSGMSGAIFLNIYICVENKGSLICHFRDVNTLVWRAKDVHDVTYFEGKCVHHTNEHTENRTQQIFALQKKTWHGSVCMNGNYTKHNIKICEYRITHIYIYHEWTSLESTYGTYAKLKKGWILEKE